MPEEGILTGTYFARDQVPDCPNFTRAKNKLSYRHRHNTGTGWLGKKRTSGYNPKAIPEDLKRLAVTQTPVRNCRLTLEGKLEKEYSNKTRWNNLAIAWIGYKMAHEMVLQSRIINCRIVCKIWNDVINFIEKTMITLKLELTAGGRSLAEAKIQGCIF